VAGDSANLVNRLYRDVRALTITGLYPACIIPVEAIDRTGALA
jgi:hypothetical protein